MMSIKVLCKSSILDTESSMLAKLFGWIHVVIRPCAVTEWNSACGEERCENSLYLVLNKWLLHVLIIRCQCLAKAVQIQQTCVVISAAAGKALTSDSDINLIT